MARRAKHTDVNLRRHTCAHASNYDESGLLFVMTGLTEPLVIGGSARKGEGYQRVIMPLP